MTRHTRTAGDVRAVDEYFNGFHDGFIRSLLLRSHDRFVALGSAVTDIGHEVSAAFEELDS